MTQSAQSVSETSSTPPPSSNPSSRSIFVTQGTTVVSVPAGTRVRWTNRSTGVQGVSTRFGHILSPDPEFPGRILVTPEGSNITLSLGPPFTILGPVTPLPQP